MEQGHKTSIWGSYFDLKYPSVDHIVDSLKELGTDALLYKIDISRAFRHLRIDPGDLDLLGLKHDQYYVDEMLPYSFSVVLMPYGLSWRIHLGI